MEGNPADLTIYIDSEKLNDHSYYGNGCDDPWGVDGSGGSITPCDTRIVSDGDDISQNIGTYYNFQAVTSGSGGAITTDNTNAPDTFCPLGWQVPYSGTDGDYYDKSKSWRYLAATYSLVDNEQSVAKATKYPFSFIYSGLYHWSKGKLYRKNDDGRYYSSTVKARQANYVFRISSGNTLLDHNDINKENGQAIRCTKILASPSSTARWQELILDTRTLVT